MVEFLPFNDIEQFLNQSQPFLMKNELENQLLLGLSQALIEHKDSAALLLQVLEDKKLIGLVIQTTKEKPLIMTKLEKEASLELINFLHKKHFKLVGAIGPEPSITHFSVAWSMGEKTPYYLKNNNGLYVKKLEGQAIPLDSEFHFDISEAADVETIAQHFLAFDSEKKVFQIKDMEQAQSEAYKMILQGKVFSLKRNNNIVALATSRRQTPSTQSVSLIYTPIEYRNSGYGSIILEQMTQRIFRSGKKFATLFTDLLDPSANAFVKKSGFKLISERKHYLFI